MSLWLQAATEALEAGEYERLRVDILPVAPIPVPGCLLRELEFAERRCPDVAKEPLFPIRFIWLMEANEQRTLGLSPSRRSFVHPEKLLELWEGASTDLERRRACQAAGFRFDLAEKAMDLGVGWIYIGEHFAEDFLEVEAASGVELLFPDLPASEGRPAFQEFKHPDGPHPAASATPS